VYDVNNWPERCPRGHQLAPGRGSMSYDTERGEHLLYCFAGCDGRSRIMLGVDGAVWEMYTADGWVPHEG
jgi:hypothetical protein